MSRIRSHPSLQAVIHGGVLWLLVLGLLVAAGSPATAAATTTRVSVASDGTEANASSEWCAINADGRFIVYSAMASNLVPGDVNNRRDVFVYDRETATTELVSVTTAGVQADADCRLPHISADGNVVAFESAAGNLTPQSAYGTTSAYVRDRLTGVTEMVSVSGSGVRANDYSGEVRLSADGRFAVFPSYGTNLVAGDTNGKCDIFLRDRLAGTTERISVATGGAEGDGTSGRPHISADGRYVTFYSDATNLMAGDTNGVRDVFVRDRLDGTTERVSVASDGTQGNGVSGDPTISGDGRFVAFFSAASNFFAPDDTNNQYDVFVHDRDTGTTQIVSVTPAGQEGSSMSNYPTISADGRYVAFFSWASNIVPGDTNGAYDVFVRDRQEGVTQRASVSTAGTQGNNQSMYPWLAGDGQCVAFMSSATNLVEGDTNAVADMFVRGPLWNSPPIAADDAATTDEDTPVSVAVLANDSDPDGDTLTINSITQPAHGAAVINGAAVDYQPNENYNGADSFTYKANDGQADSNVATVSITVNPVNDAPRALGTILQTYEDHPMIVLVFGSDVDNDPLTYSIVTNGTLGTASFADPRNPVLSYTPNPDANGADIVTYKVNDGTVDSNVATVTITITPVNDLPVASDQAVITDEDIAVAMTLAASDVDGDALTYSIVSSPAHGTLTGTAPALTYTPAANWSGTDSFTYQANDGQADSNVATVSITVNPVNDPPVANDDAYSTDEDVDLVVSAPGLIINDTDVENSLSMGIIHIVTNPQHGQVRLVPPCGSFIYHANDPNFNGSDTFTYQVEDYSSGLPPCLSNVATVTITITPVNDPPVLASPGDHTVAEGAALSLSLSASDPDGDALTYSADVLPAGATLDPATGAFAWTPGFDQAGTHGITFSVSDGNLSASETITITVNNVNRPPVFDPIAEQTVDEGQPCRFSVTAHDPDGGISMITADSVPEGATFMSSKPVMGSVSGKFSWGPDSDQAGTYQVTFTVTDYEVTTSYTVNITVNNVNQGPYLDYIADQTVAEGAALNFTVVGHDDDGDTLTYSADPLPAGATLDSATGAFAWTPGYDQAGAHVVTFTASDGELTDSLPMTITVTNVNQPPTAAFGYAPAAPTTFDSLAFNDASSDPDGSIAAWAWDFGDGKTADVRNPTYRYPNAGTYTVTLTVTDDAGASASASHDIVVTGNTPVGMDVKVELEHGVTVTFKEVKKSGETKVKEEPNPPAAPPEKFKVLEEKYYDITTDAEYSGPIKIEKEYDPATVPGKDEKEREINEHRLKMKKYKTEEGAWSDVTKEVDTVEKKVKGESDTLSWYVVGLPLYEFHGFLPPVGDAENRPFKRGSTIPVKFRISDANGAPAPSAVATLSLYYLVAGAPTGEPEVASTAAGDWGNQFRYSTEGDLYIFNLSTKSSSYLAPYTYLARVTLDDGSTHDVEFSLRR